MPTTEDIKKLRAEKHIVELTKRVVMKGKDSEIVTNQSFSRYRRLGRRGRRRRVT
jgi:hypothetical protein